MFHLTKKLFLLLLSYRWDEGSPQSSLCGAQTLKWDYRGLGYQTEGHRSLTRLLPPLRLPPLKLIQPASQLNLRKRIPSGCQTQGGLSDTNQKCSRRLKDKQKQWATDRSLFKLQMNLYQICTKIFPENIKYISLNKWSNPADLNLSLDFVWTLAVGRFNKGKFAPVFSIWEFFINKAEPKEKKD